MRVRENSTVLCVLRRSGVAIGSKTNRSDRGPLDSGSDHVEGDGGNIRESQQSRYVTSHYHMRNFDRHSLQTAYRPERCRRISLQS